MNFKEIAINSSFSTINALIDKNITDIDTKTNVILLSNILKEISFVLIDDNKNNNEQIKTILKNKLSEVLVVK